jgi:hypothetical protein
LISCDFAASIRPDLSVTVGRSFFLKKYLQTMTQQNKEGAWRQNLISFLLKSFLTFNFNT